jgi:hypothetical protein
MPQAKPEDRPGADVAPIDRRTAYEPQDVDWTGTIGPYVYRAWRVTDPRPADQYRPEFVRAVVMKKGKLVSARGLVGPPRRSVYHEKPSIKALRLYLLGKVRRRRVPQTGSIPRRTNYQERRRERQEERERQRQRYDVKTERANGKTRNRLVRS